MPSLLLFTDLLPYLESQTDTFPCCQLFYVEFLLIFCLLLLLLRSCRVGGVSTAGSFDLVVVKFPFKEKPSVLSVAIPTHSSLCPVSGFQTLRYP